MGNGDAFTAEYTRFETIRRVADDVVVELERTGLSDEDHRGAAKLEVAFLVAFRVFFSGVRLDDGSHAERPDIHKPVAPEIGVARENLPFVVGINVELSAGALSVEAKGRIEISDWEGLVCGQSFRIIKSSSISGAASSWKARRPDGAIKAHLEAKADGLYVTFVSGGTKIIVR